MIHITCHQHSIHKHLRPTETVTFQSHFLWQGFKVCTKETNTKLFDQMHNQSVTQTDYIEPTIHFAIKDVLLVKVFHSELSTSLSFYPIAV